MNKKAKSKVKIIALMLVYFCLGAIVANDYCLLKGRRPKLKSKSRQMKIDDLLLKGSSREYLEKYRLTRDI